MILKGSRYFDGPLVQVVDSRTGSFTVTVKRKFPSARFITYVDYVWKDGDEIDQLAHIYLGNPSSWWLILDANPNIHDVFSIEPGTVIRIPNG
jgi:nucleoid-associated protein YgaU